MTLAGKRIPISCVGCDILMTVGHTKILTEHRAVANRNFHLVAQFTLRFQDRSSFTEEQKGDAHLEESAIHKASPRAFRRRNINPGHGRRYHQKCV
jgi:hypothetical protein